MFNELTKRMQVIAREEKETVKDFMNSSLDPGLDYET